MNEETRKISVRLSAEEQAALDQLAARWGQDRSKTVRRLLRQIAQPLPRAGVFAVKSGCTFPIRLKGGVHG